MPAVSSQPPRWTWAERPCLTRRMRAALNDPPFSLGSIAAQDEAVLLQPVVAGEALLRRRYRGELRLAVLDESLKSPATGGCIKSGVFHHHVDLASRPLLKGAVV